jgi:sugar lactone lactonase YvrE
MGRKAEPRAGAIYRYHEGSVTRLFDDITIPNSICFAPDRSRAYFSDTATGQVMQVALDQDGWPENAPSVFADLTGEGLKPDGAVVDRDGALWIAQWGAARVAVHAPDGRLLRTLPLPALHATCPAFGGDDLGTLFVTSATQGLDAETLAETPGQGLTFAFAGAGTGLPEPRILT